MSSSFVNVRDHTSGLSNVFNSQVLTASQFDYEASRKKASAAGALQQRKFRSSYKRSAIEEPEIEPINVKMDEDDI